MRKLFATLLCAVMALFTLTGCGEETKSVILEGGTNGVEMTIELQAKGDKVEKIIQTSTISKKDVNESVLEQVIQSAKDAGEKYKQIAGADYSFEDGADAIKETIALNVGDKSALKELIKQKLLPVSDNNIDVISLEQSVKNYEKLGMKQK